jgi:hypothetical protein
MDTKFLTSTHSSCNKKKTRIIQLADGGKPRPFPMSKSKKERYLAFNLASYISPSKRCYDGILHNYIRTKRPDWFVEYSPTLAKERILNMEKPPYIKRDNILLVNDREYFNRFTSRESPDYDKDFTEEIEKKAYWWLSLKDRDAHCLLDLERFFLEHFRFPSAIKVAYVAGSIEERREGYLYYWLRRIKLKSSKERKKMTRLNEILAKSCLPKDLYTLDQRFFNLAMGRLKEIGVFYNKFGRLPREKYFSRGNENRKEVAYERELGAWLRSRKRGWKFKKWYQVALPLIEKAGLPKNLFD